jgi:ABC-type transport system involved in multi-copper enzyme maturation permease subunit
MNAPPQARWKVWTWVADWSWPERVIVGALMVAPIAILIWGGRAMGGAAGIAAMVAFLGLQFVVYRHGGWGLIGPHFYYDVVRLARRGRSSLLRVAYIVAMFAGLAFVYESTAVDRFWHHNDFARASERFAYTLFLVQNIAIAVLVPAYLGSAIAEERERRTLEILFTTHLSNKEIVLGKLFSRTIHLIGFVLAGLPILSLIQFWGGIDMLVIAGNLANTLLNILTLGSVCILISAMMRSVAGAVTTCYFILAPICFSCMAGLSGFPFVLQDARSAGEHHLTVQDLGWLAIGHAVVIAGCLGWAIASLRGYDPFTAGAARDERDETAPKKKSPIPIPDATAVQTAETARRTSLPSKPAPLVRPPRDDVPHDTFEVPYTLPPVTENPLLWKERYVGGPPFLLSPSILIPAVPFLATGVAVLVVFLLQSLFSSPEEFRRAVETCGLVLRFFLYVFLGCYLLGVAYRATSSVARERQQHTLEPLLLLPIDRKKLLWAKGIGVLWNGWPWLALWLGVVALGTLVGAFHPISAVLLCLAPVPMILFFAALGIFLSVVMETVLRANLIMVGAIAFILSAMLTSLFGTTSLAFLETCTFTWWQVPEPDVVQVGVAAGQMFAFLGLAYLFWIEAVRRFDRGE